MSLFAARALASVAVLGALSASAAPRADAASTTAAIPPTAADPRIAIVELERAGNHRLALAEVDRLRAADAATARGFGLTLLRGHLLERLGRGNEAAAAFAEAIGDSPELAPWARLRLAESQSALGHPEVAAGVAATLLARGAPAAIAPVAVDQLLAALRRGGDCRLLGGLAGRIWPRDLGRRLELARAECDLGTGDGEGAQRRLRALLRADRGDLAAFDAAEIWLARFPLPLDREELRALGEALAGQRDFARAVPVLEAALAGEPRTGTPAESETLYRLARSEFWLGRFERAIDAFEELRRTTRSETLAADALFQMARCRELLGDRAAARIALEESYALDPQGEWAGPALLSLVRLESSAGRTFDALAAFERLRADRKFESALARAALYLASSELVAPADGASPRPAGAAAAWLDLAARSALASDAEIAYWRGRLAEREGRPADALRLYVDAQRERPFHPLALAARVRMGLPAYRKLAGEMGAAAANGATIEQSQAAWFLLGGERPAALAARARALAALTASPSAAVWVRWVPVPVVDWPLFRAALTRPEEKLLALGLFREGSPAIARHFPASRRELAFTVSHYFEVQRQTGPAIELAEILFRGRPRALLDDWTSADLRRLLYPLPYRSILLAQASLRRIDPWLLAAILREESRFRPEAVSPVGARGVAQLTLPTARRLAAGLGLRAPAVADLHRPEVAIPLAAAYLAELSARFDGSEAAILAAYNAGEAQTELWRSYCSTRDPEELLAKIGFRETRAYVFRVLESRAQYAALYGL
jgi:soluble lytic murein transglycosylase